MKQTSTGGTTATRKGTRIPVAARKKALTKTSNSRKTVTAKSSALEHSIDAGERHAMIAQAAYFRAERRGFAHGEELDDWLEAEREISRMLES